MQPLTQTPPAVPKPELALQFDLAAAKAPFFERVPLGYDLDTLVDVGRWLASLPTQALDTVRAAPWVAVLALVAVLTLVAGGVLDARIQAALGRVITAVAGGHDRHERWARLVGAVVGPFVLPALIASLLLGPGAALDAPALAVVAGWALIAGGVRAGYAVTGAGLMSDLFELPAEPARGLARSLRLALALLGPATAVAWAVSHLGGESDVAELALAAVRWAGIVAVIALFAARRHLAALLPTEGSDGYLRVRAAVVAGLGWFLSFAVVILALGSLGFERAANTLLLRWLGVAALVLVATLTLRAVDRAVAANEERGLAGALFGQVDDFMRLYLWGAFVAAGLHLLGLWSPTVAGLDAIGMSVGETSLSLLSLLRAAVAAMTVVAVGRVVRVVLERAVLPRAGVDVGASYAVLAGVRYVFVALAVAGAVIGLNVGVGAFAVFAGALGVGIGFGLQDFARNMISGFVLLMGHIIRKGDYVTVGDNHMGFVEEIGARIVRLRTRDSTDIVLPAGDIVGRAVVNWTAGQPEVRVHVPVQVSHRSDVHAVREALLDAATRLDAVLASPAPDVWLLGFEENALNLELLVWVDAKAIEPRSVRGLLLFHVWDALRERGIALPQPRRDVFVAPPDGGEERDEAKPAEAG